MDYEPFQEAVIWKDLADSKIFKPRVTKMKGSLLKQPVKVLKARQSWQQLIIIAKTALGYTGKKILNHFKESTFTCKSDAL